MNYKTKCNISTSDHIALFTYLYSLYPLCETVVQVPSANADVSQRHLHPSALQRLSPKSFVPNMNIEEISLHAFAQVSMS